DLAGVERRQPVAGTAGDLRPEERAEIGSILQSGMLHAAAAGAERNAGLAVHSRTGVHQQRPGDVQELQDHGAAERGIPVLGVQLPESLASAVQYQWQWRRGIELQPGREPEPGEY